MKSNPLRKLIDSVLCTLLGRRFLWRAGRHLYMLGRGEVDNAIGTNGERYVQRCIMNRVGHSGPTTVFDVGANLGKWSRSLIEGTPIDERKSLRLYAFEPTPSIHKILISQLNDIKGDVQLKTVQLALSDEAGSSEFAVMSETGGTNSLSFDKTEGSRALKVLEVGKLTLDSFCAEHQIDHIDLVKTDTEGHDIHVLRGARRMLEEEKIDAYQFEYNHRWVHARAFLKDVFDFVDGMPYRVARLCPTHIEVFEAWHPELEHFFEGNYLILHERATGWFDTRFGRFDGSNTYS